MNEVATQMPVDPAAIAASESAKARIQAAYQMAIHMPRNPEAARLLILKECERPAFAEMVEFTKPVGSDKISGLTIRFAEAACRIWGNISTETQTIYEDEKVRRILVRVVDLQSNTAYSREIQIQKTVERKNGNGRDIVGERVNTYGKTVFVVVATEEELQTKENAIISKAIRNESLRMIPADIKEEAKRISAETIRNRTIDPDTELREALKAFSDIGIMPDDIAAYLGHKTTHISALEHVELRKILRAIKDGEAKWEDYANIESDAAEIFPDKSANPKGDDIAGSSLPERKPREKGPDTEPPQPEFVPPKVCGNTKCKAGYDVARPGHCDDASHYGTGPFLFGDAPSKTCEEFKQLGGPDYPTISTRLDLERLEFVKKELGINKPKTIEDAWKLYYKYYDIEFPEGVKT